MDELTQDEQLEKNLIEMSDKLANAKQNDDLYVTLTEIMRYVLGLQGEVTGLLDKREEELKKGLGL